MTGHDASGHTHREDDLRHKSKCRQRGPEPDETERAKRRRNVTQHGGHVRPGVCPINDFAQSFKKVRQDHNMLIFNTFYSVF